MKEKTILKISLLVTLFGLILLFLYAEEIDVKVIESIDNRQPEELIKIRGVIEKLTRSDKVIFLQITGERTETTDIIFFPKEDIFLQEGNYVEITGKVEDYQGKKEVIAEKVILKG